MADTDAHSDVVNAAREDVIAALLDFDSYTDWQAGMLECTVKERDAEGRGSLVEIYVDAKVKKIRYTVRYHYDLPDSLGWDYVGGDLKECRGTYTFAEKDPATTQVSIDIETEIGFFVPGPMKKLIRDQSLKNSMRDLKKRVE
ncbi:MAG: hypothetical protein EPN43_12435 [Jatrophihabitans sp.]|nr:MAG: hypothetical protein EPN43_12435 [Jatrophihabitans sp.]